MVRSLRRGAVIAIVVALLSHCSEAQVTPEWNAEGSYVDEPVIGEGFISMPVYSGTGELPVEGAAPSGSQENIAPEPTTALLAALGLSLLLSFRRRGHVRP